jgi:hypothetical protein
MPAPVDNAAALLPQYYSKPGQLRQEYLVDAMLREASIPAQEILQRRAPVPMVLNPPRLGYRRTPLTIQDVLATDRWAPKAKSWFSGAPAMPNVETPVEGTAGLRNASAQGFT